MRIVVHREIPDDPLLRSDWNALVEQMESPQVFYTHEWARAIAEAYADCLPPWLLLTYDENKLTGVASLTVSPDQECASFLAGTTADYCDFVSDPSHREALLQAVFWELRSTGVKNLILANLPADSNSARSLSSTSRRHGYRLFLRPAYLCAQVKLGSREERQAIKRRLEKRKLFRYSVNSLAKKGAVLLVHVDQWEAIEPVLNSFARAHVARFLVARIISNLAQARRRAFLAELGRRLSASGWLVLSKLMVNDHPVAWNYGFRFHGNWFWYQPTFDTDLEESSPGYCLLSKIISEACDHSEIEMVDLGLGAEGYKDRFANAVRPTLHGTLSLSPGQQVRAVGRYRLAQAVKVFPPAESAVRSLVERMIAVRSRFRQSGVSGTTKRMWARLSSIIAGQEEVVFYEWPDDTALTSRKSDGTRLSLKAVSLEILADAVMRFENDAEARAYLLRSAQRLRERQAEGFVLFDGQSPVHFCWVTSFAGFWMDELRVRLEAPEPAAAMIFDCWTPPAVRGLGYYGMAVQSVARRLAVQKRHAWIFSSAKNRSSMTALGATVFQRRYTMVRHTTLMFHRFEKLNHQFVPEAPVGSRS